MNKKEIEQNTITSLLYLGAVSWLIYGIIECTLLTILPWILQPAYVYRPSNWVFTAILFVTYGVFGAVITAIAGKLLVRLSMRQGARNASGISLGYPAATLTIAITFAVGVIQEMPPVHLGYLPSLVIALLLVIVSILCSTSSKIYWQLRGVAHPFTASILLLGQPWIDSEILAQSSALMKILISVLFSGGVLLLAYTSTGSSRKAGSKKRPLAAMVLLAFGVLLVNSLLEQSVRKQRTDSASSEDISGKPNVILISLDTVRADHLSIYGYSRNTTPVLEEFVKEATLYRHSYSTSAFTLPSHASMFTGLYARQHGIYFSPEHPHGRRLPEKMTTLAEILAANGYLTMSVVANFPMLGDSFGLDQGFQYLDQRAPVPLIGASYWYLVRDMITDSLALILPLSQIQTERYRDAETITDELIKLVDQASEGEQPFFLFTNYMDAHWPYIPPSPFDKEFPGKNPSFDYSGWYRTLADEVLDGTREVDAEEHLHLTSQYDGGIRYIDENLGKLFKFLRENDLYDNTLIIVTGDHGEAFGERQLIGHGISAYQNQIAVPLVIKFPNVNEEVIENQVVSGVDVLPTILDGLGLDNPDSLSGTSLSRAKPVPDRYVISESFPDPHLLEPNRNRLLKASRAIFFDNYKLISPVNGEPGLYDLTNDPLEIHNIYGNDPLGERLLGMLDEWMLTTKPATGSDVKLDERTMESLKALGYIE